MNKKQRVNLIRILAAAALLVLLAFVPAAGILRFFLYMIPYGIVGYDIIIKAVKGILHRQPFDECLLMVIATAGAIALALYEDGDYREAIAVMLFYQVGEWFQSYAVGRSRKSITELMDICPDYANIEGENGQLERVDPDEVEVGTIIVVQAGEKIPIDGLVVEGRSSLDTAALTGESVPRDAAPGDRVISGCINQSGLLKIRTEKEFDESTASKVLELISDASSRKSKSEDFITKFARIYTPAVVFSAMALAVLPPLILLASGHPGMWGTWVYRALTFLVISCPCALVVSIPLSFFAGIGGASRAGILVKGSNFMETLADADTVAFDKTGTLTRGVFEVTAVHPREMDERELLHMAAHVERYSTHPIANSLRLAYPEEADSCSVGRSEELPGEGVFAEVNGHKVWVGNTRLMERLGVRWTECEEPGTILHVAIDGTYEGHIAIADVVKPHSAAAIRELKRAGVKQTVMLTGDRRQVADRVAADLQIDRVYSELLPQNKVEKVEELLRSQGPKERLAFVGDGINDAPVLARADIGIAMGAMGSDAAVEAADVVLMDDDPLQISTAIRLSRKCLRIVRENIWFAIGVKLACLALGAVGIAGMWAAIFADVGVMILCVLNAVRCLAVPRVSGKDKE